MPSIYAIIQTKYRRCRSISAFPAADGGAVIIEFMFLAPLFLLLMVNIITGGIYLSAYHILQHVTAEAARASLAGSSDAERLILAQQRISSGLSTGYLVKPQAIKLQIKAIGPSQATFRVALSFDARTLGLSKVPGFAAVAPTTLTASYDVRPGGI